MRGAKPYPAARLLSCGIRREEASAVWRFLRVFKTAHHKVDDFRDGRSRQLDHEFLADCGVEMDTEAAQIALAVRRAVAGIGLVDPLFVRATDSYPGTLEVLPLWDSMDWLALEWEIERELGQRLPWHLAEIAPTSRRLTVSGLVSDVQNLVAQTPATEPVAAADRPRQ